MDNRLSRGISRGRGSRVERIKGTGIGGSRSNSVTINTDKVKTLVNQFEPIDQAREPTRVDLNNRPELIHSSVAKVVGKKLEFSSIANMRQQSPIQSPLSDRSSSYPISNSPNQSDTVRRALLTRLTVVDKTPSNATDVFSSSDNDDEIEAELCGIRSTSSLTGIVAGKRFESPLPPLKATAANVNVKKRYHECTPQHAARQKKDILKICNQDFNQLLTEYGLCVHKILLVKNTNKEISNSLILENLSIKEEIKPCTDWKTLKVKDSLCIADEKYSLLRKEWGLQDHLPVLTRLQELRDKIGGLIKINQTYYGVNNDIPTKLKLVLEPLARRLKFNEDKDANGVIKPIRLRLAGDGTVVGKRLKILNFTFACLNDEQNCKTANGNYTIGIWEIENEDYTHLSHCLGILLPSIESINQLVLNGETYKIEWYFGGDYKFLLNLYGNL
jgi:hypothetical protein